MYTCVSESVLAEFIPHSIPKFKYYRHKEIPYALYAHITNQLKNLKEKVCIFNAILELFFPSMMHVKKGNAWR